MSFEIELSKLKKAKISEFKGIKRLDIRNYYEKNGEEKPTQKGISLTAEQWQALLERQDEITLALGIDHNGAEESTELADSKTSNVKSSPLVSKEDLANDEPV